MLFLHIVDDYYLQGFLATTKQKSWWREQKGYDDKYKHDYICALIEHGFSWTFMIMLPWLIVRFNWLYVVVFVVNWIIHSLIDNLKANKKKINLCQDQLYHVGQIVVSWILMCVVVG